MVKMSVHISGLKIQKLLLFINAYILNRHKQDTSVSFSPIHNFTLVSLKLHIPYSTFVTNVRINTKNMWFSKITQITS